MLTPDFLHRHAETRLSENYTAVGASCTLWTNSEQILKAARENFLPVSGHLGSVDFSMRFWVDGSSKQDGPRPKPYVRGLDHLVFIGLSGESSLLVNLRTRHVIGRFSQEMATDTLHWKMIVFPLMLSVLSGSVGLLEIHASCVAKGGAGFILSGPSQAGKSTLALALSDTGFHAVSDDRTFCSLRQGELSAWGLPRPFKLRPGAATWFEAFRDREPTDVQNGELVFHFDPQLRRAARCKPRALVFLDRQQSHCFEISAIDAKSARTLIESDLLAESPDATEKQSEVLERLFSIPCCWLRYGGRPHVVAEKLSAALLDGNGGRE